jgi:hypothetical protein
MNLPKQFDEWRTGLLTKQVLAWLVETQCPAQLNALLTACAQSNDPKVREMYAYYFISTQTIGMLKGDTNAGHGNG